MNADRDIAALEAAIREDMDAGYELVYVDYRDQLSDEQVAMLVRGDMDSLYDDMMEWECDNASSAAYDIADDLAKTVIERWEREDDADYSELSLHWMSETDPRQSIIETIRERDTSEPLKRLASLTPNVLLRILIHDLNEDADYGDSEPTPHDFLTRMGWEATDDNVKAAEELIAEAAYPGSVLIGYVLAAVSVSDIYAMPYYATDPDADDYDVVIRNPHVYLGNPFAGSGWASGPFTGDFVCKRSELTTDKDAFGYGWQEITGGVVLSAYEAEITVVPAMTSEEN